MNPTRSASVRDKCSGCKFVSDIDVLLGSLFSLFSLSSYHSHPRKGSLCLTYHGPVLLGSTSSGHWFPIHGVRVVTGRGEGKIRLDHLLVQRGLVESREKAKAVIMAGLVEVDQVRVDKPGHLIAATCAVSVKQPYPPYVSRGGVKLEAALEAFAVDVRNKAVLDVGSSTGGFTDSLLQRGAKKRLLLV